MPLIAFVRLGGSQNGNPVFCFGLPGNPVSAFIMFELLVKPFLFKMMGHDFKPVVAGRQLEKTMARKKTDRDSWLPVVFTKRKFVKKPSGSKPGFVIYSNEKTLMVNPDEEKVFALRKK